MLLTEQEIFGCLPSEEDTIEFARAIESAVLEKLKAQEPVGETVPSIVWEGLVSIAWEADKQPPPGTKLYEHPLPPDDVVRNAERYKWLRDVGQEAVEVFIKVKGSNAPDEFTTWHGYSDMDAAIDKAMKEMK